MASVSLLDKWRLLQAALSAPELSPAAKCIMGRLLFHLNTSTGQCTPSFETLARGAGITRFSAIRAVRELIAEGWLERDRTNRQGNLSYLSNSYRPFFERGLSMDELVSERTPPDGVETDTTLVSKRTPGVVSKRTPKQGKGNKGKERGEARERARPRFSAMDYLADRMVDDE